MSVLTEKFPFLKKRPSQEKNPQTVILNTPAPKEPYSALQTETWQDAQNRAQYYYPAILKTLELPQEDIPDYLDSLVITHQLAKEIALGKIAKMALTHGQKTARESSILNLTETLLLSDVNSHPDHRTAPYQPSDPDYLKYIGAAGEVAKTIAQIENGPHQYTQFEVKQLLAGKMRMLTLAREN